MRQSLVNAGQYRRIDAGHPLQTAALYRLHLALLHRALEGPGDVETSARWYRDGFPADRLEAYLDRYADRFDLFGPQPFMQVPDLNPAEVGENFRSHWVRLSAEEGSPNTTALYNVEARPGGDRTDALLPAQAALRLLEHQSFALGGLIKRFTTSSKAAPVATAALFLAEGSNLHQTLCLNLVPYPGGPADTPPWERPPLTVADIRAIYAPEKELSRVPGGYVGRYAWLSRSVLLLPEEAGTLVRTVGFGAGEPLDGPGEGTGTNIDPMVSLRPSRDPKNEQPFPYKLRRDRLLWRDMNALLPDAAAENAQDGKLKVRPGRPPETVSHARAVMLAVRREAAPPPVPPPLSQDEAEEAFVPEGTPDATAAHPVIPVVVFGQLTDQGKAFAMRQETYTLPEVFLQDPGRFRDDVKEALEDAGVVGDGLRQSVRWLASGLLSKGGEREPHKDDVGKLAAQIPAEPTYWAGLDTPFRTFLADLDRLPRGQARARWRSALRQSAHAGWRTAQEAAGLNAVGLRAVQKAGGPLGKALAAITTPQDPETT
ncbi:CRISPR-associated Cse1 family protein [Deinococcus phoenicis]|uniref:CRISPR-associated Cse1 family protein n=1 Tax=Deinococcus phoenicis TaxID=1476583 RepID=A0A016QUI5_9DEIO|nr:CRISPR-associated Cse1 family protein [Deinococcus phoenicis]